MFCKFYCGECLNCRKHAKEVWDAQKRSWDEKYQTLEFNTAWTQFASVWYTIAIVHALHWGKE